TQSSPERMSAARCRTRRTRIRPTVCPVRRAASSKEPVHMRSSLSRRVTAVLAAVLTVLLLPLPASAEVELRRVATDDHIVGLDVDTSTGRVYALEQYVLNGGSVSSYVVVIDDGVITQRITMPYAGMD